MKKRLITAAILIPLLVLVVLVAPKIVAAIVWGLLMMVGVYELLYATGLVRHPRLVLIVAHMGMPEYSEFLDLAEQFDQVWLDTTMAFTPFVESTMPFPPADTQRLHAMGERILFGSDFPNIPYGYLEAMTVLTTLSGIDDDWLRGVLYGNAARLFALTG